MQKSQAGKSLTSCFCQPTASELAAHLSPKILIPEEQRARLLSVGEEGSGDGQNRNQTFSSHPAKGRNKQYPDRQSSALPSHELQHRHLQPPIIQFTQLRVPGPQGFQPGEEAPASKAWGLAGFRWATAPSVGRQKSCRDMQTKGAPVSLSQNPSPCPIKHLWASWTGPGPREAAGATLPLRA